MKNSRLAKPFGLLKGVMTLAALALGPTMITQAADYLWSGASGTYNNPAAWGGTVPGVADKAINDNGAGNAVQINIGDPDWIVNGILAGRNAGNGAFVQNGQTVYLTNAVGRGAVRLGVAPGRTGAYTLNGGALNYTGEFNVGELGSATLNVNGGSITGSGNLAINVGSTLDAITATMGGTNKSDYTWFEQGFFTPVPSRGIPAAGSTFVSETLPDHSFTMPASYSANNAVQVFAGIPNATITFTAPVAADTLSLLGSSGFGTSTVNYTINYADTTTQSGSLAILDWFDNSGAVAFRAGGRSSANGLVLQDNGVNPVLSSFDIALANTTSPVTSIVLTHNGGGGVAAIMAVSSGAGGVFTPRAFTGYNQDIVFGAAEPVYVASNVTNVLNQVAGSINVTGEVFIGNRGAGVYNFSGGTNNFANWFVLGRSGGHGRMTMTGGQIDKTGGGNFVLGTAHQNYPDGTPSGVLTHSGGVINSSGEFMIPENAPATGEYNISGTAVLNVNNWMQVGRSGGSGLMNMTGGSVTKTGGGNFIVGDNATGVLNQSGGSISVNNEGWVGQGGSGNGTYNMSGGSIAVGNWIAVGRGGGVGVWNLTNGVINKVNNGNFAIGSGGGSLGTLNQYGGAVSNTVNAGSITYLGEASGNGTWNLFGGTAHLGVLQFCQGGNGSGSLFLNGGLLNVREVNCGVAGANGAFYFNGGTLQANADNANFFSGLGATYVDAGGAVIDSQGFNVTMAQALIDIGGGGLTKLGTGTLTLNGANSYSGATLVNAGTLAVTTDSSASSAGGYTVATGAKLAVKVQFDEAQLNTASATFAAGATTLQVDLGNFGNPTLAPINLSGDLAVNGTVTVNLSSTMPQIGQFPLIKYGTKSGAGSFVIGALPFGVVASIVDNVGNNSIDINITAVNLPRWEGQAGGNWDVGLTTNWINIGDGLPTFYGQGNAVLFDDNATGVTTPNLVTTVTPTSVTFNNSSLSYTLNGSGKISGSTGLSKQGTGTTTIANTGGNDYTGATVISGGTLSVSSLANGGSPSAIGASSASAANLVLAGGTLDYTGPNASINRGYSVQAAGSGIGVQNNLTLSGAVTATAGGGFTKTGLGQINYTGTGSNILSGAGSTGYQITDGGVRFEGVGGGQTNLVQGSLLANGTTGNATVRITNSVVYTTSDAGFGQAASTTGTLVLETNSVLNVGSWFLLGDSANAVATATINGGTLNVPNGRLFLCSAPGTIATLNITNGVINKSGDYFAVVNGGWNGTGARTGIVNQVNSTVGGSSEMWVGDGGGLGGNDSLGIYNLYGGTLTVNNWMGIGRDGCQGIFNMTNATLTKGGGGDLVIGRGGNGTVGIFNMTGGALNKGTSNPMIVGQDGGTGTFNQNGGAVDSGNEFWVGQGGGGTGVYNMNGGTIAVHNWVAIGRGGGNGTFNMVGGTFTKDSGGNFIVGDNSTGLFNQSGGATLSVNNEFWVGQGGSGNGTFNLTNGSISVGNWVAIGRQGGRAVFNMEGGTFTKTGGGNFLVPSSSNSRGTLNHSGGTINVTGGAQYLVPEGGNATTFGTNNISGTAAVTVNSWVAFGRGSGFGLLNMSGGSFSKVSDAGSSIIIGANGPGQFIQTGGTLSNTVSSTWISEGNTATWDMSGGAAILGFLQFARNGSGVATLNFNGGTIAATEIAGGAGLATNNYNGGTIVARASTANFLHDLDAANVLAGGLIIDSSTNTIGVAQALWDGGGAGGVTKIGTGTLRLNGVNTYTGATLVNAGTLGGTGTIAGPVSVAAGASFAPGASIGTLTINNTLNLAAGSSTVVEITMDGGATNDVVTGLTGVTYGGSLVVTNVGSNYLVAGTVFKLFNSAAPGSGNFSSVTVLPAGTGTFNPATGELTITSSGILAINPPVTSGGNLILTGFGGTPGGSYSWLTATNVAAPVAAWTTNTTGVFSGTGTFSNAIPVNPAEAARFFRLKTP